MTKARTALAWAQDEGTITKVSESAAAGFDPNRFVRGLITEFSRVDNLAQCTDRSFAMCALGCAQLGLYPGAQNHIHLIPREKRKRDGSGRWITDHYYCTLIVGYRGLLHAVRRAMPGVFIDAVPVYEADNCIIEFGRMPRHTLALKGRGERIGVYAVATVPGTDYVHHKFIPMEELDAFAERFTPETDEWKGGKRTGNKIKTGPWVTDREQMELKTALRRLCKVLPTDRYVDDLLALEDSTQGDVIDVESVPAKAPARNPVAQTLALGDESSAVSAEFIETETAEVAS